MIDKKLCHNIRILLKSRLPLVTKIRRAMSSTKSNSMGMDLSVLRSEYNGRANLFLEEEVEVKEPFYLFDKWFQIIKNDPRTVEPNAMCLATATKDGTPSARFVLLKGYSKNGFIFFTHYTSRKGQELEENPKAALTFYWEHYSRSVRVEGVVEKLPYSDADAYFKKRPYQSQIGALCSNQSKPVAGRTDLAEKEYELKRKYNEGQVPRPPMWGGYMVKPDVIEFWQGQTDRIHDRIRFRRPKEGEPDGKLSKAGEDADAYFKKRPYQSQIGTLCSNQSKPVAGRTDLAEKEYELKRKYNEGQVPRPPMWGGYIVKPDVIEFWQGQTDRIHGRIRFRRPKGGEPDGKLSKAGDGWIYERLCP